MIPGVDRYAERHAAELVTQVGDTTKDRIRGALSRGLREGEDIPTIAARIQESGAFAESRATLIARTEVTTVSNASQVEGLKAYAEATGEEIRKTWLATRDDRTREEHMEMDGVELPVDAEFDTPDFGLMEGPSAPNCRCTLTYRLVREGEE
jgi:SPP1 gp7 family putative phage head morphogenesis protein